VVREKRENTVHTVVPYPPPHPPHSWPQKLTPPRHPPRIIKVPSSEVMSHELGQALRGASRIGQFGDSLMEGDAVVGRMLDALQELGLAQDTIVMA
jgi:arylsulfatase A-like enzyme